MATITKMPGYLTSEQIARSLPKIAPGLVKYLWLQANRDSSNVFADAEYRRRFNAFYVVRRNREWQDVFYRLLEEFKTRTHLDFGQVLNALLQATGRYEASFASKLLATLKPERPIIDSVVLGNLNLRLPVHGTKDRAQKIIQVYEQLQGYFWGYLKNEAGSRLILQFRAAYPDADISPEKMLDLVLWQSRD